MKTTGNNYRIFTKDGRVKFTGTLEGSWFSLEKARELVDREKGETIYLCNGGTRIVETF